jgi:hypothetical protein
VKLNGLVENFEVGLPVWPAWWSRGRQNLWEQQPVSSGRSQHPNESTAQTVTIADERTEPRWMQAK